MACSVNADGAGQHDLCDVRVIVRGAGTAALSDLLVVPPDGTDEMDDRPQQHQPDSNDRKITSTPSMDAAAAPHWFASASTRAMASSSPVRCQTWLR